MLKKSLMILSLSSIASLNCMEINNNEALTKSEIVTNNNQEHLWAQLIDREKINEKDDFNNTQLWYAVLDNHIEWVRLLILNGADVNNKNKNDVTPLMAAAVKGYEEIVILLLAHGADISIRDNIYGYNALKYAQDANHIPIIKLLDRNNLQEQLLVKKIQ